MHTLYALPDHFRSFKIQFAAALSGTALKVLSSDPDFKFGDTNKSADFLKKFPLGKVPALETDKGVHIFESNAIAYFVSNEQLRGVDDVAKAQVNQWINFADNEVLPSACQWVFPTLGITQYNKQATESAKEQLKKCLVVLNAYLADKTYLVSERITLGDVVLACNMLMLYKQVLEPEFRKPYTNVNRWFTTIVNHPEFVKIANETVLCTKMAQPDNKKFAELHGGQQRDGNRRQSGNKGGNKPASAKKEKEQKPKDAANDEPAPVKEVDPLASAPKGTFDMDAFKRCFSNEDTKTKAIPYLWEHFDAENYSIYHAVYKYKSDLTFAFMSGNLAKGLTQRVEKLRKHAFGILYVLGVDNDNNIEMVWIFRGKEIAFGLTEDWNVDAPSYDFYKMDPSKQEDRDKFNAFLLGETVGSYKFPGEDLQADYVCFK